jgi:hypothetical protein
VVDLVLTQRGEPAVLGRQEYEIHWADALAVLEAHRVLRIRVRTDYVLVNPNQYVGSARCGDRRLRVEARYPDLLAELRRGFPRKQRRVRLEGYDPGGKPRETRDDLVRFLAATAEVVHQGVPFSYEKRRDEGTSLRGALNIGQTVRKFASKGIHHRTVTERSVKTADASTVDIVWRAAELLQDEGALSPEEEGKLEVLLTAIGPKARELSLAAAMDEAELLHARSEDRIELRELAICCANILSRNRTEADIEAVTDSVSFVFTDADTLWELAVHRAMQQVVSAYGWRARLHPLRGTTTRLFEDGGPDVDPDVLIYGTDESVIAVVDAKDFAEKGVEPSGVYQVAAYARSLKSNNAVLIYLASDEEWRDEFGDDELRIHGAGVRPAGSDRLGRLRDVCREIAETVQADLLVS